MTTPKPKKEPINWPTAVIILGIIGTLSLTFTPIIEKSINGTPPAVENAINKDLFNIAVDKINKIDDRSQTNHTSIGEIKTTTAIMSVTQESNTRKIDKLYDYIILKGSKF